MDINSIEFKVVIYFSNGSVIERSVDVSKAYKLSRKHNVIIPEDTEVIELHGVNGSIILPINMTFVINASPTFNNVEKVSRYMLYRRDEGKCGYCGKRISQKEATVDHIIPKSRGGLNIWENVVLACRSCNCKKDNFTPAEAGMKLLINPYNPKRKLHKHNA